MARKNEQDIWVKACIYEYDYVVINPDTENDGSVSDRVALEYFGPGRMVGSAMKTPSTMHAPMRLAMTLYRLFRYLNVLSSLVSNLSRTSSKAVGRIGALPEKG